MSSPGAPALARPSPTCRAPDDSPRTTCDAEVCVNALARTHHACREAFRPVTSTASTRSASSQRFWAWSMPSSQFGNSRHRAAHARVTARTDRHERMNTCPASSRRFGSMMACEYSSVAIAPATPVMAPNEPKTPKSAGVKSRLMTGDSANPNACAMTDPVITTRTFLTNGVFLSLTRRSMAWVNNDVRARQALRYNDRFRTIARNPAASTTRYRSSRRTG